MKLNCYADYKYRYPKVAVSYYGCSSSTEEKIHESVEKVELNLPFSTGVKPIPIDYGVISSDPLASHQLQLDFDKLFRKDEIKSINPIVENKVVEVIFNDDKKEKIVCREPDIFDIEKGLYIALAKKLYRKEYTFEGILKKAEEELPYQKKYVKTIKNGVKLYYKALKEKEEKELEKARYKARKEKKIAYKKRRDERKKNEELDKILSAISKIQEVKQDENA